MLSYIIIFKWASFIADLKINSQFFLTKPLPPNKLLGWVGLGYFLHVEESPKPNF